MELVVPRASMLLVESMPHFAEPAGSEPFLVKFEPAVIEAEDA